MNDDGVVLRSSWLVDALITAPVPLGLWFLLYRREGLPGLVWLAIFWSAATLLQHHTNRIVLTADGVELWRLGRTAIPWSYVRGLVFVGGSPNLQRSVAVLLPDRSARQLPAPRSVLGIGGHDVAQARELIEQHWLRHRAELMSAPPAG